MADDVTGLAAAVGQALAPPADDEQMELIALDPVLGELKGRPGKGRPPGARNKRTQELADYILSRHRNPVEAAAQIVDTPIPELALALKCTTLDAAGYWRQCAEFVARYTLQAMPQAVKIEGTNAGQLMVINMRALRPGETAAPLSPFGLDLEVEQNQGLSEADPGQSHGEPSHGDAK